MHKVQISTEDCTKINKLRTSHSNRQVRKRLSVLHFKSLNFPHKAIQIVVECSSKLVVTTLKTYQQEGLQAILKVNRHVRASELDQYKDLILEKFRESPPISAKEASEVIYKLTNIKRGLTQTKQFLHKIGLKPRKTAAIPAKADPEKQEEFKKKVWNHY